MKLMERLLKDRLAAASLAVVAATLLIGLCAPLIAPHSPNEANMELRFAGASWSYWLGNDHLGRCILSRLIYGIRPSVLWVLAALGASAGIGAALGFAAGYFLGKTDAILMRICDIMLSFPGYVMTLAIVGMMGAGLTNILIAFVMMKWAWFARVIRTAVMQYADADYVKFAKVLGIGHFGIMTRHIAPVALPEMAVIASGAFGSMILQISGLSFLGLGIQAPHPEWGMMMNEARAVMFTRPELMLAPGLAIIIVVSAVNFLSDALQKALDPKLMIAARRAEASAGGTAPRLRGKEVA
ncbi:ABC transporter permease subunit [Paenibacillus sp. JMULE4]|uniref:staphylopine uptake ABC transporter permease subunit CntC n=1 Tax=Paenibacillus TaxID=44249 RepID=UPI000883864D|nr:MULTISPECIES: nickel/cobalt ABC transporter permease [Paenibacillus]NTZ17532.1 ABC transporter permease subunit [Paenibacillus sp. JMULE4]GCL74864.1 peptide ABC transporter permease [Paenibacillus naphthalenovorans]SDJ70156.1 nickel transport system permease protein [Paenibacillus naphthalenovorans]